MTSDRFFNGDGTLLVPRVGSESLVPKPSLSALSLVPFFGKTFW